jgi:transcriptional regulator with XRE-family HTH domain
VEKTAKIFAENLRAIRVDRGLTQDALSERLGVATHTIQNWERERRWPDPDALDSICKALHCSIADLLRPKTKPDSAPPTRSSLLARIVLALPALDQGELEDLATLAEGFAETSRRRDPDKLGEKSG